MSAEFEFADPGPQLIGRFTCVAAPNQAEGTGASKAFYFRSRRGDWSFAVALSPSVDPVDIMHAGQRFFREGACGSGGSEASYLPLPEALAIIKCCAREVRRQAPT